MAKTIITVGLRTQPHQVRKGEWEDEIIEIPKLHCNVPTNGATVEDSQSNNPNEKLNIRLSFVLSNTSDNRLSRLIYAEYMGVKYKITNIDTTQPPRVIITLGEVYHDYSD